MACVVAATSMPAPSLPTFDAGRLARAVGDDRRFYRRDGDFRRELRKICLHSEPDRRPDRSCHRAMVPKTIQPRTVCASMVKVWAGIGVWLAAGWGWRPGTGWGSDRAPNQFESTIILWAAGDRVLGVLRR